MDSWTLRLMCCTTIASMVLPSYTLSSTAQINDSPHEEKGRNPDCISGGFWFTSIGERVTNVTGRRYVFRNGSLFPETKRLNYKGLHLSYRCSNAARKAAINADGDASTRKKRLAGELGEVVLQERFAARVVAPGPNVNVVLGCSAIGAERLIWGRDGRPLPPHLQPMPQPHPTQHDLLRSSLNISHVSPEDGGLYSCTALSRDNTSSVHHAARIDVYGSPYIRPIGTLKAIAGSRVVVHCPYYGYPISKIQWDHKRKVIGNDFNMRSSIYNMYKRSLKRSRNDSTALSFSNVTRTTDAKSPKLKADESYSLKAPSPNKSEDFLVVHKRTKRGFMTNKEGILIIDNVESDGNAGSYTCSVTNPSGEMAKRDFDLIVVEPPVLEEFSFGLNLQEGQIAQATCSVRSGDSPIFFSWLKDNAPIPAALKIEERVAEVFSVLLIRKVRLQHCGTYTCVASNHAAKVNQSAELYVKVAPKWISEPQNTSVVVGRVGNVACSASGYPQPQVHWMKRDENLGTWRPVLELRGSGLLSLPNGSLLLEMVAPVHEGLYSCTVDNGVPQPLNKAIWISVNKPATFELESKNLTTRKGYPVTITCEALGDHPIRIVWKINGRSLEYLSNRIKISSQQTAKGAMSEVAFGSSNPEDAGHYQCEASNPHGSAQQTIHLVVQEPPGIPFELSVEAVWSRAVRLGWRSPSGPPPLGYMLQFTPHGHPNAPYWEKSSTLNFTNLSGQQRQKSEVSGLTPATPYIARLCSLGELDSSPFTRPLLFTTLEESPEAPPASVTAEATASPGELRLSWLPPHPRTVNGILLGYIIKAIPQINDQSDDNTRIIKVSPTKDHVPQYAVLSGLLKSTRYSITISCYNSAGQGPPSPIIYHVTREGVPEAAPALIECTGVSSTALRVSWRALPQHLQGGAMQGYVLFYTTPDGYQQNVTTMHNEAYIQGLLKFTNYTLEIGGYCSQGMGPLSSTVFCSTMQDLPSAPAEVKAMPLTSEAIIVSWRPPPHPNGRITHYTVYVKSMNDGVMQTTRVPVNVGRTQNPRTLVQPLRQLQEGRSYETWVTATSGAGEGEPSRHVLAEPTDRVIAGIASLGGEIWTGSGKQLLMECYAVGNPQPRTVWYHNNHVITHHPRFTFNKDDSLLINNIDQSLEGNYTCLAKNLYGSDRVEYIVGVLPIPAPPTIRLVPAADSILVEWTTPTIILSHITTRTTNYTTKILGYLVGWREADGKWSRDDELGINAMNKLIRNLRCATLYEVRVIARSTAGESNPAMAHVRTIGDVLTAPIGSQWIWSNATGIVLQTDSWGRSDCGPARWSVDYRQVPTKLWLRSTTLQEVGNWGQLVISGLTPGCWYQLRVTATNAAGATTAIYNVATKTLKGEEIGPYSEPLDTSFLVIVCSSVLLILSIIVCIIAAIQKHRHKLLCGSVTSGPYKEPRMAPTPPNYPDTDPPPCPRLYSSPVSTRKPSKASTEMFEISPYAQFTMGFQTFGHAENQDRPGYMKKTQSNYNTDTSFQVCSESDDSDSLSKSTTIAKGPSKMCRVQYHR